MIALFALKQLGDLLLYLTFAQTLCALLGHPLQWGLPLCALLAAAVGAALLRRRGVLRWLPIALCAVCLTGAAGWWRLAYLPPVLALVLTVRAKAFMPDYDTENEEFVKLGKLALLPGVICLLTGTQLFSPVYLPLVLAFAACKVLLLRTLRHDDAHIRSLRLWVLNGAALGAVLGFCALISSPAARAAMGAAVGFVYRELLTPVLMAAVYIVSGLAWLLHRLLQQLRGQPPNAEFDLSVLPGDAGTLFGDIETGGGFPPLLALLLRCGAVLALLILAVVLLRRLRGRHGHVPLQPTETHSRGRAEPARFYRPPGRGTPREAVRYYFYKFLLLCRGRGLLFRPSDTSQQIVQQAGGSFSAETLESLRAEYIRARYSPAPIDAESARRAQQLYRRLREENRRRL